ncbi:Cationic amino acid transporter 4 like protein [Argiope bruennichi]|uniref:Cationic amino acid transporter 4 like protein n=1 Tax=Argiope bruennichi TaxID=94029 RepID=A0A8T0FTV9_ARGBR|nr:Cationic amino acid transporter 4 like protein [Argiope bruennichi]
MMADSRRNSELPPKIRKTPAEISKVFRSRLTRRKVLDPNDAMDTSLRRCLSTVDITLLAIGHMVGSGVYVLTGTVAKNMAGPSIVVSFVISGFASLLASLSYAEMGVRYPKCGSAYSYTYLALGEIWAFLVGWSMALENAIGAAATARACSAYIDSLTGGIIRDSIDAVIGPVDVVLLSDHMDIFAVCVILLFVIYLSFGIKFTSYLTNVVAIINVIVIIIIISTGAYYSEQKHWSSEEGGFFPYGWSGTLAASASCFYAFVGLSSIATAGEETKDPQRTIPKATIIVITVATLGYVGASSVLTLMVNYKDIADESGFPEAFAAHGVEWAKFVVVIGAVCGMAGTIIGSLFSLTRIIYVMADDGLLFTFCSKVNVTTKTPLRSMYVFAVISMILALTMDIHSLVEILSIGTLFAYMIVSASVIILRYRPKLLGPRLDIHELTSISENSVVKTPAIDYGGQFKDRFKKLKTYVNLNPGRLPTYCVISYVISCFSLCVFSKTCFWYITECYWWAIAILCILLLWVITSFVIILLHQQSSQSLRFKVPLVPFIPAVSILMNLILVVNLQTGSWLRMLFWLSLGLSIYLSYGVEHSKLDIIETTEPPKPRPWSASDSASSFDARRKAGAAMRTKPPVATTLSREFLFTNVDPIP